jgi:hypothetical protein
MLNFRERAVMMASGVMDRDTCVGKVSEKKESGRRRSPGVGLFSEAGVRYLRLADCCPLSRPETRAPPGGVSERERSLRTGDQMRKGRRGREKWTCEVAPTGLQGGEELRHQLVVAYPVW